MFCTVPLSEARIRDNLWSEFVWQFSVLLSQKHDSAIIWGQNLSGNVLYCSSLGLKAWIRDNLWSEFVRQCSVLFLSSSRKHEFAIICGQSLSGNVLYCSSLRSMNLWQSVVRIGFVWKSSGPDTAPLGEAWIHRIWSEFVWQCSVLLLSRKHESTAICGQNLSGNVLYDRGYT